MKVAAYGTPDELAEVKRRAAAHGCSMSRFLMAAALSERPDARAGTAAAAADEVWDSLPPTRRVQIIGWLARRGASAPDPMSEPLFDLPEGDTA